MEFRPRKHNTPVATLLRNYENKQSGKVVESRKEIQWRFDALDWKGQKKILKAFLASGKSDREWAARQLVSFWDSSFEPVIKKMWEETQDVILAWPIIRYFPVDYLKSNIDRLGRGRSYYFLSLRLADDIPQNDVWEKKVLARMKNKNPALSGLIKKFELTETSSQGL